MNILLYDPGSYIQSDLIYYLEQIGHHCKNILYKFKDSAHDDFFERRFLAYLKEGRWDCVMSTNFFPIVARICHEQHIKYLAWVYDCPIKAEPIEAFQYPTSYTFLFDQMEVERIQRLGGTHVFHLPLAASPRKMHSVTISAADHARFDANVSFVGQFYDSPLEQLMFCQSEYDKGYVDAIVQTQLKVYGYSFIEEMVTTELVERMNARLSPDGNPTEVLTVQGMIHSISTQVTHIERLVLCNMLGELCTAKYYSNTQPPALSHLQYGGSAHYHTEMPKIFRLSKLNLNPTLRSIHSGIPLRALDILSCGGVLLSNYQPELAEYFVDGEDVILYESLEDAVCKADYYLKHEEERRQIAQKGYEKVMTYFSYPDRIQTLLQTAELL